MTSINDVVYSRPEAPCHGCAHSAAGAPFPGFPSGERPCCFCKRHPDGINVDALGGSAVWYDGETPAFKTPMDCYIATDRSIQGQIFKVLERVEKMEEPVTPRTKSVFGIPSDHYCCEGGDAPGGHTWTCIMFLGVSYG